MATHKFFHRSLAFAVALTFAGTAFARRPEAVVDAQTRAARILATCEDTAQSGTKGYRDMYARVNAPHAPREVSASHAALRRMSDHVVLVCEGGRVHGPGGYRDMDVRFRVDPRAPVVAGAPRDIAKR